MKINIKEMLQRTVDTLERIEKKMPKSRMVKVTIMIGGEKYKEFLTGIAC